MFRIERTTCSIKPNKFENIRDNIWYYNFNILEIEDNLYEFSYVRINGTPTIHNCYEALSKICKDENLVSLYTYLKSPKIEDKVLTFAQELYDKISYDFDTKISEIDKIQRQLLKQIDDYDTSLEVNSFYLNNQQVWLDKTTRVGLMNSLQIEKDLNKTTSVLWFGDIKLEVNIDIALNLLKILEIYALECYNKTSEHKQNVKTFNTKEELLNYDYRSGYPDKLIINI